ncbi:sensor histidine kinase [Rhizomonospora bruguierae]|uniref:sensor histidine kinase n=1 Tax=Rhizomonospora bruguierae TaxID=1581705 RepID=UPI0020BFC008|nr:CHASE3 domain-containing protein [Micromonospora sp. NBRC 107566]
MTGPTRRAGRWTLRQRVAALCAIVGLLLAGVAGAAALVANRNRSYVDASLNKTGPLRTSAEALSTALVNQETAVRGYAVTGNPADLAPYGEGQQSERALIAEMRALVTDRPQIERELTSVERLSASWRAEVAEPVREAVARGDRASAATIIQEGSRQRFDEIRAALDRLQQTIVLYRNEVADKARSTSSALVLLLIVAAGVVIVAGVALLALLDRLVSRPVTHLAEQVREVARGAYQRDIEADGPPELARLARDVDGMRRQIAADLAEVTTARAVIQATNDRLEAQAAELTRSNRDLEQFAYVASHDLQEPLRKVASFCQLLQRRYAGRLDERADQYIAFAVDGAQRMQRLINDLLSFSRIGRLTAGFTDVDLNAVMDQVNGQLEVARAAAEAELSWSDLPVVRGEEPLLTTLLANLVSNSIKFRRPQEPPRVRVSAERVGDEWQITCRDNGIGIEGEFADKVFVIFQRLHPKDAYPGTGIGLAIAKKIVEYHGGRIWVDPEYRDGTAISFTLPIAPEGAGTPPPPHRPAAAPAPKETVA